MSTRSDRDFLQVQLIEMQKFSEMVGDHPLMSIATKSRIRQLEKELAELPTDVKEARAVLFFSGDPVQGSIGIDANFVGLVLKPFQFMVMAAYADRWHGSVGLRGRRKGEDQSRLLLTGLPRGSFGLELSAATDGDPVAENRLADTLAGITRLVDAAARSDEDFAGQINESAPRVIQNLRDFLGEVARGNAGLRLESGDFRCSMNPGEAKEAFNRVSATTTTEEEIEYSGIFGGALLNDWRFNFATDGGLTIAGRIDDSLSEKEVISWGSQLLNQPCVASLTRSTVRFRKGEDRTTYTLKGLREVERPHSILYPEIAIE